MRHVIFLMFLLPVVAYGETLLTCAGDTYKSFEPNMSMPNETDLTLVFDGDSVQVAEDGVFDIVLDAKLQSSEGIVWSWDVILPSGFVHSFFLNTVSGKLKRKVMRQDATTLISEATFRCRTVNERVIK